MSDSEYMKEYYKNNKEKWKIDSEEKRLRKIETQKRYAENHKESVKKRRIDWTNANFEWEIWSQAKRRAARNSIEFNLEKSDIIIPTHCPYLGWEITTGWGNGRVMTNASIDRIDNSKGYIKGNIQILSRQANEMKRDISIDDLIKFAQGVLKTHLK
jgi:hypothetical protein